MAYVSLKTVQSPPVSELSERSNLTIRVIYSLMAKDIRGYAGPPMTKCDVCTIEVAMPAPAHDEAWPQALRRHL